MWGLVRGYTPVRIHIAEGRRLRINIRTDLLRPAGKFGILHLNGTKIYLQEGRRITIGSSKESDIRIKDNRIEDVHLKIKLAKDGFELEPMSINGNIAVADEKTKQVAALSLERFDLTTLAEGGRIFFELTSISPSGKKQLLEMKLEIPRAEFTQAVHKLLEAKPTLEQIIPEQALARSESHSIDWNIVKGTIFSEAERIDEIPDILSRNISDCTKKGMLRKMVLFFGGGLSLSSWLSFLVLLTVNAGSPLLPALFLFGVMSGLGTTFAVGVTGLDSPKVKIDRIKSEAANVLKQLNPGQLAEVLAGKSKSDRKAILMLLNGEQAKRMREELEPLLRAREKALVRQH
jgi:hypothetical protein